MTGDAASETLTAYTGGSTSGTEVFTLTLNGDGSYTFTLINPIDHPGSGEDSTTLDLSALIKAVDFDGDAVTLSGDRKSTRLNSSHQHRSRMPSSA